MAKVDNVIKTQVSEVTLTLNQMELKFLSTVLRRIGGNPETSLRKYAASITEALAEAGIDTDDYSLDQHVDYENKTGKTSIYFKDNMI